MFAYCGNNPVNRYDCSGQAWYHWVLGATVVAVCAVATVITCGGIVGAATAVCMVGNGIAAASSAATITAGAFISSATVYGMAVYAAASEADSVQDFASLGNWGTVAATATSVALGGYSAYSLYKDQMTTLYRAVGDNEAADIRASEQFNLNPGGMECKQFGFSYEETRKFGEAMGKHNIVSVDIPKVLLNQFCNVNVDTTIFRSGTLTVYAEQLPFFNQLVKGTIHFLK